MSRRRAKAESCRASESSATATSPASSLPTRGPRSAPRSRDERSGTSPRSRRKRRSSSTSRRTRGGGGPRVPAGQGRRRGGASRPPTSSSPQTYTVAYIAHAAARAARRRRRVERRQGHRLDGHAAPVRRARRAGDGVPHPGREGARHRARHRLRLRRQAHGDAAVEAARLAKAAGKPVKVVWTREEEFTWAYFRPAGVIEVRAARARTARSPRGSSTTTTPVPPAIGTPYDVANQKIQFHPVKSPLRQGSYRALAATANHFARESHMDELAHALGMDPLAFRLKNLSDARLRAVFEAAAEKFGWGKRRSRAGPRLRNRRRRRKGRLRRDVRRGRGRGRRRASVRILRVVAAFECGAVVNPDGLRNQVEGAIVQGIGGALFEAIRFENGKILNPHFAQYRLPRFTDVPAIDVVLLDRKDLPSGGRRRDADRRHRAGRRQRDLRRDGNPPAEAASRARRPRAKEQECLSPTECDRNRSREEGGLGRARRGRGTAGGWPPRSSTPAGTSSISRRWTAPRPGASRRDEKARSAALFLRPTKAFQEMLATGGDGLRASAWRARFPSRAASRSSRPGRPSELSASPAARAPRTASAPEPAPTPQVGANRALARPGGRPGRRGGREGSWRQGRQTSA